MGDDREGTRRYLAANGGFTSEDKFDELFEQVVAQGRPWGVRRFLVESLITVGRRIASVGMKLSSAIHSEPANDTGQDRKQSRRRSRTTNDGTKLYKHVQQALAEQGYKIDDGLHAAVERIANKRCSKASVSSQAYIIMAVRRALAGDFDSSQRMQAFRAILEFGLSDEDAGELVGLPKKVISDHRCYLRWEDPLIPRSREAHPYKPWENPKAA
ncbi:MAG: hypothetical protein AAGH41_08980 [Pseudomonadota bacterium]